MSNKKKKAASTPNGSDDPNADMYKNHKDIPAQFDEAWFKSSSRTVWLVKWDTTNTGYHCVLTLRLPGKNSAGIAKSIKKVISKYQVGRVDLITCDFKEYFRQKVEERGPYLCLN
jgi:hypothetical protein